MKRNLPKLILDRLFPHFRARQEKLLGRIDDLTKENDDLRARVVAAQQAKQVSENQSNELRSQKERLREKVRTLRASGEDLKRRNEVLAGKVTDLQIEVEELKDSTPRPARS